MNTTTTLQQSTQARRPYAVAAAAAVIANLIALGVGSATGATLEVNAPEPINALTVGLFTVVIMAVAGVVLQRVARRRPNVLNWAPTAGLAFAVVSAFMPFLSSPDTKTGATLAAMHLTTGIAWYAGTSKR